jgi:uncharacterized protein YjiK
MWSRSRVALLALLTAGTACVRAQEPSSAGRARAATLLVQRASRLEQALQQPVADSAADLPLARWLLPSNLAEVSGLALDRADRLFAHDDENGHVFEIDYRRGLLVKEFLVGPRGLLADFEGLTIVGGVFYMFTSDGRIFTFREGGPGARVSYAVHDTHLGRECEFEGITYDATIRSLVMACKHVGIKHLHNHLVIYRWKLERGQGDRLSRIAIPEAQVIGANDWKKFEPSDITVDPATGNYVIIASRQKGLVELTPAGAVVRSEPLPEGPLMAEGVAITRDRLLIISAEATAGSASLSLYRRR